MEGPGAEPCAEHLPLVLRSQGSRVDFTVLLSDKATEAQCGGTDCRRSPLVDAHLGGCVSLSGAVSGWQVQTQGALKA